MKYWKDFPYMYESKSNKVRKAILTKPYNFRASFKAKFAHVSLLYIQIIRVYLNTFTRHLTFHLLYHLYVQITIIVPRSHTELSV